MSGRKQHYIPQLLLRGFRSREKTKPSHAWVFPVFGKPYESNIESIGAERDFYVFDENLSADDHITSLEPEFGELIGQLRNGNINSLEKIEIVRFIIHIQARARWFRNIFTSNSTALLNRIFEYVQSEAFVNKIMDSILQDENPSLQKDVDKIEPALLDAGIERHLLIKRLKEMIADNRQSLASFLRPLINEIVDRLPAEIEGAILKAHIDLQLQDYSESERFSLYQELEYSIVDCSPNRVILGDCTVLSVLDNPRKYTALASKSQCLTAIILPISSTKYLIGSKSEIQLDANDLNVALAELSDRFFVSSKNEAYEQNLQKRIGIKSYLLSNEELERIANECISANI